MHTIEEPALFRNTATFLSTVTLPIGTIDKQQVKAGAGLEASKLEHQHRAAYAQESATASAAEARVVHVVKGTTGTIETVKAGCVVANIGDATVTVDVLVNGASILTAAITLSSAQAAYGLVAGTIDSEDLADGDVVEVSVTVNAGGGTLGKGVFAYVDMFEDVA